MVTASGSALLNQAMQRKLDKKQAIDVADYPRTARGDYVLPYFVEGADYCDSKREAWIWSIAKLNRPLPSVMADGSRVTLRPGTFLASQDTRFYHASEPVLPYECVFLR